jgi:ABC-type dipeptide/oligopeptide/nickel transport system permease component
MYKKLLKRVLHTIVVLIGVSILAFALVRLGGGDPTRVLLPEDATEAQVEAMRVQMGLDKPLLEQYFTYMAGILRGDLGYSYGYNIEVSALIAVRLPKTILLSLFGLAIGLVVALPLGIMAGTYKGSIIDVFAEFLAILGQSISTVWLALLLVIVFCVNLHWLPTTGSETFAHWILPGICMSFNFMANCTRMLRSGMVEVLEEDYITATRARGIPNILVNAKYALRNALMPIVTMIGSSIGKLVAGSIVIENIFGFPGIGQLVTMAINTRDYQLVQSLMLVCSAVLVLSNLIADMVYTLVDPRVSFN